MQLTSVTTRPAHLLLALQALSKRPDHEDEAQLLLQELSGITALVAKKFTNDKTADGVQEAYFLTTGCISLGISQAYLPRIHESYLAFLQQHGAEYVFQMGFRHIKELANLPYIASVSDFDNDPYIKQRNLKSLFHEICRADPNISWTGDEVFRRELQERQHNQLIVDCARWLRKQHHAGPIKDSELDANAVLAICVIFGILGDGNIVARTGQKEIENLISRARNERPDIDNGWNKLIRLLPPEYQPLLRDRMETYRDTIVKKILSKAKLTRVVTEIQDCYVGNEMDIEYP